MRTSVWYNIGAQEFATRDGNKIQGQIAQEMTAIQQAAEHPVESLSNAEMRSQIEQLTARTEELAHACTGVLGDITVAIEAEEQRQAEHRRVAGRIAGMQARLSAAQRSIADARSAYIGCYMHGATNPEQATAEQRVDAIDNQGTRASFDSNLAILAQEFPVDAIIDMIQARNSELDIIPVDDLVQQGETLTRAIDEARLQMAAEFDVQERTRQQQQLYKKILTATRGFTTEQQGFDRARQEFLSAHERITGVNGEQAQAILTGINDVEDTRQEIQRLQAELGRLSTDTAPVQTLSVTDLGGRRSEFATCQTAIAACKARIATWRSKYYCDCRPVRAST